MATPQASPIADLGQVAFSPRAQQFFDQVFKPRYTALQQAVRQTPLVILVWGPGASAGDLYRKRLQIRDELRRLGHAAVFSEELAGGSPAEMSQKGIEFLQAQAADLIVVMQTSYGSVAEVHDFASYRIVNFKMLIFIDERAQDGYSYRGALTELKTLYNNVETFKYPDDITQCHLLRKVIEKVNVLQMVKYRDQQNVASWAGVNPGEPTR
ncbi:MAG: hypothetical protein HY868_09510 [Chloroflexi bacterium]|nr:hypothetical protein [Chloroflexota bacterium]